MKHLTFSHKSGTSPQKRLISACLAGAMLVSASALAGCGKKNPEPEKVKRTNVYGATAVPMPEGIDYVQNSLVTKDKIYLFYQKEIERPYDPEKDGMGGNVVEETIPETGILTSPEEPEPESSLETETDGGGENGENGTDPGYLDGEEPLFPVPDETDGTSETDETSETDGTAETDAETETDGENEGHDDEIDPGYLEEEPVINVDYGTPSEDDAVYYDYLNYLYRVNLDGTDPKDVQLPTDESDSSGYMRSAFVDASGLLWLWYESWIYDEETGVGSNVYTLRPFDPESGAVAEPLDITSVLNSSTLHEEGVEMYLNTMMLNPNDNTLYLLSDNGVLSCDLTGQIIGTAKYEEDGWLSQIILSGQDLYISGYPSNGSGYILYRFDSAAGTLTKVESTVLQDAMRTYYNVSTENPEGKLYMGDSNGVMSYDFATDTLSEVMNYINCDIDTSTGGTPIYVSGDRFIQVGMDYSGETRQPVCNLYNRIPDEELQEEIIVNLATIYTNYNLRRAIIRFNRRNTGVRISVTDYNKYNTEENQWSGATTQLNTDLVMGNAPDILVIDSSLPVESYFQKNIFIDLNPYLDGENGIDRSTLLDNILRATETADGKLNSIIPSFYMYTLAAKSKFVGTEPGWTLAEMMETLKNLPEGMSAFMEYSRDNIIDNLFQYSMDCFIDWDNSTTYFDTPEFIELLEYLKTLPEKGYWEEYYDGRTDYDPDKEQEMQTNYELRFYQDRALFGMEYMGEFRAFQSVVRQFATEDVTLIGYPTRDPEGNGATIIPNLELAICTGTKCPDQAWEFLKYLLTDETFLDTYEFTINKAKIEEMIQEADEQSEYYDYTMTDEDYQWYEENYSPEYVEYLKATQNRKYQSSDGEKILDILTHATRVSRTDTEAVNIIKEELSSFFGGTRSAADTADIIQSRVKLYVAVNS